LPSGISILISTNLQFTKKGISWVDLLFIYWLILLGLILARHFGRLWLDFGT